jgi:hypothetical protein
VPGQPEQFGFQIVEGNGLQQGGQRNDGHDKPPEGANRCLVPRMAVGSDNSGSRSAERTIQPARAR